MTDRHPEGGSPRLPPPPPPPDPAEGQASVRAEARIGARWSGVAPLPRRAVWAIASGLFLGTFALLMATLDMGYTRDESFYFRYAMSYQEWFVEIERAEDRHDVARVMERDRVIRTWAGNFEHPSLMKSLFGFSWRALARKDRPATLAGAEGGLRAFVSLGAADGFEPGAEVMLLAPFATGPDAVGVTSPGRELARGRVVERQPRRATVALDVRSDEVAALLAACAPRAGGDAPAGVRGHAERYITGCQARELRVMAVLDEATSMRLPTVLLASLAVALTFLLGLELFGWIAGLFGALAFLFVPRHFFHAHLTCFDMPIVTLLLATLYAFWRARDDRRWALGAAVLWGLALQTKLNAFFLPVPLLCYWLWVGRHRLGFGRAVGPSRWSLRLPPLPLAFLTMPVVGLPILFAYWPKLWYDPMRAMRDYVSFHVEHEHYMQSYFGEPLQVPPFPVDYPFVMTGVTVPEVLLLMIVVGLFCAAPVRAWGTWLRAFFRREAPSPREDAMIFSLANGLFPIVLIALPSTPIFGGVKHWMTGMPFLLLIAGYGFQQLSLALTRGVASRALRRGVVAACGVLILAQPAWDSLRYVAIGTGYYNSLAMGGLPGAADRKMMRLFWGYTTLPTFAWVNLHAPPNARVFFQNTTWDAYAMYQRMGLVREDIRYADGPERAQIALMDTKQAFWELELRVRRAFDVPGPYWQVTRQGVPFMKVYVRPDLIEQIEGGVGPAPPALPLPLPPRGAREGGAEVPQGAAKPDPTEEERR